MPRSKTGMDSPAVIAKHYRLARKRKSQYIDGKTVYTIPASKCYNVPKGGIKRRRDHNDYMRRIYAARARKHTGTASMPAFGSVR